MISIGSKRLTSADFADVLYKHEKVDLDPKAMEKVNLNFNFLTAYSKDKVIYGINTGFGPMAQYKIERDQQRQLQYNLIRSHSSGAGEIFPEDLSRATMLARLNGLMQGSSGIHEDAVRLLTIFLNKRISARIFQKGGVGASGDLVQLAHLTLNMIGEGEVLIDGKLHPAAEIFKKEKLTPLNIYLREGLALLNGTSAMTGVGMVNIIQAKKILNLSVALSSITNELMKSYDDHFSAELNQTKPHQGQQRIAEGMRKFLNDSKLVRKRPDHLYNSPTHETILTDKVQEYYSLRCVPQVLGPAFDTIAYAEMVLENEVNSVNDNPVIDHVRENVFHGGNFHGDYVSLEMDKLKIVITKVCMLAERQLNFLLNDRLNQKLPAFVNLGVLGLNFGMQGMQFTATSTTAENQTLSYPMYLHSIPNNNDNQDIVSMGCNAAFITRKVIDNTFDVLAIQAISLMQAIDYLKCQGSLSTATMELYNGIRAIMPSFIEDQPKYKELQKVKTYLINRESSLIF